MAEFGKARIALGICAAIAVAGCEDFSNPFAGTRADTANVSGEGRSTTLVERDVEAPDVFQVTEKGLWDGRPSLGGVWVAYPGIDSPERVIIRNEENGAFVIGALYDRERENPGPALQLSSDAASALEVLAGRPTLLNVTALRKEAVSPAPPAATPADTAGETEEIETRTLDPVAAAAADAIEKAEAEDGTDQPQAQQKSGDIGPVANTVRPAARPDTTAPTSPALEKPYIQIGIFSIQDNAEGTGEALRNIGIVPTILKQESQGKLFWRVIVGPMNSASERAALLDKVKDLGFSDAYFVTD